MCIKCKRTICICIMSEIICNKPKKKKVEWVSTELGDNHQDFLYIKGLLERKLGIRVTKTMVFKHCLVIALNHYGNGKGVQNDTRT